MILLSISVTNFLNATDRVVEECSTPCNNCSNTQQDTTDDPACEENLCRVEEVHVQHREGLELEGDATTASEEKQRRKQQSEQQRESENGLVWEAIPTPVIPGKSEAAAAAAR